MLARPDLVFILAGFDQDPTGAFTVDKIYQLQSGWDFAPNLHEQKFCWVLPGMVVGVTLWLAASLGFRLYLRYFNTYNAVYGSLVLYISFINLFMSILRIMGDRR